MISASSGKRISWRAGLALIAVLSITLSLAPSALAQEIHSAHVDRDAGKIVLRGAGFTGGSDFVLAGVSVAAENITPTVADIPFNEALAQVVQWPGSYRLTVDGAAWISVYFDAAVVFYPEPPPGGPDCPCISQWEASAYPLDNFTLCYYDNLSQQQWISGQRGGLFISASFDPGNILFDPVNPGNSVSYCALVEDGTDYLVAEPVVNQDQYDDCWDWFWSNVCL